MDSNSVSITIEIIKALPTIIASVAAIIASAVAIYGINSWRREHTGKRRIELAEDTLAFFYEAKDAISHMRSPLSWSYETEGIERSEKESDASWDARKSASVLLKRYNDHQELFNKLHAMRYRFMAQVGKKEAEPFEELRKITIELTSSARTLARLWARNHFLNEQEQEKHYEKVQKYEAIFWECSDEDDPINLRLDALIDKMEKTCKAIISGKDTLYGFLNFNFFEKKD
jgi:hypothetical protein